MHFRDLDVCRYHVGPFDAGQWKVPLRAVGWLEHPHEFTTGSVPNPILLRLSTLLEQIRSNFPHYLFRGVYTCSVCEAMGQTPPQGIWSQENLWVPGRDVVYLAPGGILHYIQAHFYLPPSEFMESIMECPNCDTPKYLEALRTANRCQPPPLQSIEDLYAELRSLHGPGAAAQ